MPQTAELNMEERTLFAFCVYLSVCIETYDEESDKIYSGLVLFQSVEQIRAEYEYTKSNRPDLFENRDTVNDEEAEDYGYSVNNPIQAVSIGAGYAFLNRLAVRGGSVTYERDGSYGGRHKIIDCYTVTVTKRSLFGTKAQIYKLYIDPYATTNSKKAPKPFFLL